MSFGAGHKARPNCVIIDEIDGVSGENGGVGAIQMLVKIVQAESKAAMAKKKKGGNENEEEGEEGSGSEGEDNDTNEMNEKSKKRTRKTVTTRSGDGSESIPLKKSPLAPLRRPIICICNDQFASALRPLRQIARIFEFTSAPKAKFVDRLKYIATREGMQYDPRTMGALADVVDMDIRSALNTLQFVHNKGQRLTANLLNNLAIGRKDVEK